MTESTVDTTEITTTTAVTTPFEKDFSEYTLNEGFIFFVVAVVAIVIIAKLFRFGDNLL